MWTFVPEAGIKDTNKHLHSALSVGYNYLSLPLIHASGTPVPLYFQIRFMTISHAMHTDVTFRIPVAFSLS